MVEQRRSNSGSFKLIFCVVHEDDANALRHTLAQEDFESTVMSTTGGFLRKANVTLLIGVEGWRLPHALSTIRQVCHSHKATLPPPERGTTRIGAATILVLDVESYHRI